MVGNCIYVIAFFFFFGFCCCCCFIACAAVVFLLLLELRVKSLLIVTRVMKLKMEN